MQSDNANENPIFLRNRYLGHELNTKPVATTDAITDNLILDYDNDGKLVAITLDNYTQNLELNAKS